MIPISPLSAAAGINRQPPRNKDSKCKRKRNKGPPAAISGKFDSCFIRDAKEKRP